MGDINTDLPIIITQLPQLQKAAHAELPPPDLQQAHAAMQAQQFLRQQNHQVQKVEAQDPMANISKDGSHKRQAGQFQQGARKDQDGDGQEQQTASNASPWAGNIIDVKI